MEKWATTSNIKHVHKYIWALSQIYFIILFDVNFFIK